MTETGADILKAVKLLSAGQLVAIPTETVYGLAANALDADAVVQIFAVKERPAFDPLIVHLKSLESMYDYASEIPATAMALASAFWPGPLTLVLPKKSIIPDLVSSGLSTVGLRVPSHPLTLALLHQLPFPLAAPSANPFGYISPTTPQHVHDQLQGKIPYILDGGPCSVGVESTIVGFEGEQVLVYRLGGLTLEDIRKVVPHAQLQLSSSSDPKAPGMLLSHYAPRKKLLYGDLEHLLNHYSGKRVAVISFSKDYSGYSGVVSNEILSPEGNLTEAAAHLFTAMRKLDKLEVEMILAEPVPDVGLGRAINDRLRRASA
jgi:L-threonylcarbamoyladenylate synthase